jgi:hypothetical protein
VSTLADTPIRSAAGISDCGKYRYWLTRVWDDSLPVVVFVMLNPSTADASIDDPTIRRCIAFAKLWSYGGLTVVNLYAWRATDPSELPKAVDPVGPQNDTAIKVAVEGRDVVCAWGAHMPRSRRPSVVMGILTANARSVACLGCTSSGRPRHPLYLKADSQRQEFGVVNRT